MLKKIFLPILVLVFALAACSNSSSSSDSGVSPFFKDAKAVSAGGERTIAIKNDGSLWVWGSNWGGQFGNGTTYDSLVPVQTGKAQGPWDKVSAGIWSGHIAAINTKGDLYTWGVNWDGQLGDGTDTDSYVPVQVLDKWKEVSTSYWYDSYTVAIKTDGSLWIWGNWGIGSSLTPLRVGSESNWSKVSTGYNFTLAIKENGDLYSWGENWHGCLGNGTDSDELDPVKIGTDKWDYVFAGPYNGAAINTKGELYTWGDNSDGQLGKGTKGGYEKSPQRVGSATNWKTVVVGESYIFAINTQGELYACGWHVHSLGDGTTESSTTLIKISDGWNSVSVGNEHVAVIKKADGGLWSWGRNMDGQLGDGTSDDKATPVRVVQPY